MDTFFEKLMNHSEEPANASYLARPIPPESSYTTNVYVNCSESSGSTLFYLHN